MATLTKTPLTNNHIQQVFFNIFDAARTVTKLQYVIVKKFVKSTIGTLKYYSGVIQSQAGSVVRLISDSALALGQTGDDVPCWDRLQPPSNRELDT